MVLALACFARSSRRFHDWLFQHALFGPPLQRWQRDRVIPIRAKVMAPSMMTLSLAYVVFFATLPSWALVSVIALIVAGVVFMVRYPHRGLTAEP